MYTILIGRSQYEKLKALNFKSKRKAIKFYNNNAFCNYNVILLNINSDKITTMNQNFKETIKYKSQW